MAPYDDRVEHHVARSKPAHEGGSPAIALSETRHGAVSPPLHAKARSRVHGGGRAPGPILRGRRDARALCVTCGAEWLRKRLRLLRLVNAGRCAPKWSCNKWLLAMRGIFWLVQRRSQTVLLMRNEKESPPPARTCWSRHGFGGAFSLVSSFRMEFWSEAAVCCEGDRFLFGERARIVALAARPGPPPPHTKRRVFVTCLSVGAERAVAQHARRERRKVGGWLGPAP